MVQWSFRQRLLFFAWTIFLYDLQQCAAWMPAQFLLTIIIWLELLKILFLSINVFHCADLTIFGQVPSCHIQGAVDLLYVFWDINSQVVQVKSILFIRIAQRIPSGFGGRFLQGWDGCWQLGVQLVMLMLLF